MSIRDKIADVIISGCPSLDSCELDNDCNMCVEHMVDAILAIEVEGKLAHDITYVHDGHGGKVGCPIPRPATLVDLTGEQ